MGTWLGKVLGLRQLGKCLDTAGWTFPLDSLLCGLQRSGPQCLGAPLLTC